MPSLKYPRLSVHGLRSQANNTISARPRSGVLQDKRALTGARKSTKQPARMKQSSRADGMQNGFGRSQTLFRDHAPLDKVTLHVKPIVKERLLRLAKREGISVSKAGAAYLEKSLQQEVDMSYGALLTPIFEAIVDKRLAKRDARLAHLLVRNAFASEQARNLVANILSRMPGVTPTILEQILDRSAQTAKSKITHTSPQLEDMLTELEAMLDEKEARKNKANRG